MKRTYSLIAATLSVSLFIYLFYRSEKTVVNELIMMLLPRPVFTEMRNTVANVIPLSKLVVFSLPGGLWVFCTTLLSKNVYLQLGSLKIHTVSFPILFAVGLEFCQLIHLTRGTFDRWDIGAYLVFWLLACYGLQARHHPQQNITSPFTLNGFVCLACFLSVYLAHVNQ